VAAPVALVQLQHRNQAVQRGVRRGLRFGERAGDGCAPSTQAVLQRRVQIGVAGAGAVPVEAEGERFLQPGAVERLQQVVDDIVLQAGDGDVDVTLGGRHDDGRRRVALTDP
jgi:hypothetical protein